VTELAARDMMAKHYVDAFMERGSTAFITNLETQVCLFQWGQHAVPLTVNNGGKAQTFVCSPLVGYLGYTREELQRFPNKLLAPLLRAIVASVGAILKLSDLDRIVHINNWMMSTNLPVDLDTEPTAPITEALAKQFPKHVLAMRSLNARHSAALMKALAAAGWILLPSRQVYLVNDVKTESLNRRDSKNDQKIWNNSPFAYQETAEMTNGDAARIAKLYELLYLEKYSRLNPAFTPEFVMLTHKFGVVKYLVFRDQDGDIQSFGGFHRLGTYGTMPLMGYNTSLPQNLGLYRLACHAGSLYAARLGLQLNMSSGAATYKRTRGATPEMEFTAYYLRHLPVYRQLPVQALRLVGNSVGIPILRRYEL
jgi:hypothetical protein